MKNNPTSNQFSANQTQINDLSKSPDLTANQNDELNLISDSESFEDLNEEERAIKMKELDEKVRYLQ